MRGEKKERKIIHLAADCSGKKKKNIYITINLFQFNIYHICLVCFNVYCVLQYEGISHNNKGFNGYI